ncbi:MAG: hypothetical protein KZQ88_03650 [Candidatus Thiodiazotropha sp. (ex Dulcina madagascariensis)]|nr:hypothetical protein [Candidatus Thiodiazotropha sp. (ex Dulcina madagascariensis)]MCU7925954.1 hypothetical protein [Candidatus Thiodiazotropha sp. (ex Dulcina madagascariensis)]
MRCEAVTLSNEERDVVLVVAGRQDTALAEELAVLVRECHFDRILALIDQQ